jgi:predicted Rossmann fold nucleotide-binding protein DprA/Smf involved in DNA uptake
MITVGFTGTRAGMNDRQRAMLAGIVEDLLREHTAIELHHGCAVGADTEAHWLCSAYPNVKTVGHPCKHTTPYQCDLMLPIRPPLHRNRDIVEACTVLIAVPRTRAEELRSGTWATVRYARKLGRTRYMLLPDHHTPLIATGA